MNRFYKLDLADFYLWIDRTNVLLFPRRRQATPRTRHTADAVRRQDSDQNVLAWSMRRLSASNALTQAQMGLQSPKPMSLNASINSKE